MGIGPTLSAWKAGVLPLNYTRRTYIISADKLNYKLFSSLRQALFQTFFLIITTPYSIIHIFNNIITQIKIPTPIKMWGEILSPCTTWTSHQIKILHLRI